MSIASQLTALEGNISNAYNMVAQRGGTVPARKNMENLDDAIATIPSGGSFIGVPREVSAQGVYQMPTTSFTFSLPNTAINVSEYGLYYAFVKSSGLTAADLSSLTALHNRDSLHGAFYDCPNLASVDLSSLTTISGQNAMDSAFYSCSSLVSVDLSSLATVSGNNALKGAFTWCRSLVTLSFPSLSNMGSYTNQFDGMLNHCSNVTVHFPAALQSTIGSWTSVQNGFGGTNTTVLFDL